MRIFILAGIAAGLLLPLGMCRPAFAAEAKVEDVLAGKVFPLSLKLKELDDGWRRFTPGSQANAGTRLLDVVMTQQMNMPAMSSVVLHQRRTGHAGRRNVSRRL